MYLFWKPSSYLIPSSHYNQVLTGVLPYHGNDKKNMTTRIHSGKPPFRLVNPGRNRWLHPPVLDAIRAGWDYNPKKRHDLSVMRDIFFTSGQQVQDVEPGGLNTQINGNRTITETSQTQKQGYNNV